MPQFPVSDQQGIIDGLNYVLSGPSGTGQNFAGVSIDQAASLSGNYRPPFTNSGGDLTVGPIALSTSEWLDPFTYKFTFATTQAAPPFQLGNNLTTAGTSLSFYNDYWGSIGVIECTVDYVILHTSNAYANPGTATGGEISFIIDTSDADPTTGWTSTDCNAKSTVTSQTDRVFINAQINTEYTFKKALSGAYSYTAAINRYRAVSNYDPSNPDLKFIFDRTISQQEYIITLDATVDQAETFTITAGVPATNQLQRTYFIPNATTTAGTGSGVNLNITVAANATVGYTTANTIIEIAGSDGGQQYSVGDTILIDGADLGGITGTNDLALTVASVQSFYTTTNQETIFGTVIDSPVPGYYWYILELKWFSADDDVEVLSADLGFRNLTTQVVKQ